MKRFTTTESLVFRYQSSALDQTVIRTQSRAQPPLKILKTKSKRKLGKGTLSDTPDPDIFLKYQHFACIRPAVHPH